MSYFDIFLEHLSNLLVGYFDITKYDKNVCITTKDVILTMEQLYHIIDNHPEVLKHLNKLKYIFKNPDIVLKETNKKDTYWIIKKIDNNLKITLKINTVKSKNKNYKNSIIQMQYLNDERVKKYILSKKVIILFDNLNNK